MPAIIHGSSSACPITTRSVWLPRTNRKNIRVLPLHRTNMSSSKNNDDASGIRRRHLVFCYGDSLTAGTSGFAQEYPYAKHLQQALAALDYPNVQVEWLGLPGWTADNMVQNRDDGSIGLQAHLQRYNHHQGQPGAVSLVILLAGTNDMGYGFDQDEISANLRQLHETCFANHVARTIAIGIPPSGYQSMVPAAADLASAVSSNLRQYCQDHADRSVFVDFPFCYEKAGKNWDADGLHFSPEGYKVLGEYLAPTVRDVLESLDKE